MIEAKKKRTTLTNVTTLDYFFPRIYSLTHTIICCISEEKSKPLSLFFAIMHNGKFPDKTRFCKDQFTSRYTLPLETIRITIYLEYNAFLLLERC